MSESQERAREIASKIVDLELADAESPREVADAIERMLTRLEQLFCTLVGTEGFRATLQRAVHLTGAQWPLTDAVQEHGVEQVRAGSTALIGELLQLLFNFIGEDLTLRLLRRVWRELVETKDA